MTKQSIGDVNPQFMKMYKLQDVVNTYDDEEFETPVIPTVSGNKAIVMEILRVFWFITASLDLDSTSAIGQTFVECQLTRDNQSAITRYDSDDLVVPPFQLANLNREIGTSANQHSDMVHKQPYVMELTDGQGNGIIYSGRELFLGIGSSNLGGAIAVTCWLQYRLVKVDIREFLGEILS